MQKIRDQFRADIDVWYMSQSEQRWGAKECTPDESAEHIKKYYVDHHKSQVPMGVWAPPVDDTTSEPGAVLARKHPTFEGYRISGVPVFVVVDGQGRVRRIIHGVMPQLKENISSLVTYLLAEAKRSASIAPSETSSGIVSPPHTPAHAAIGSTH
jgi:hypothetical protein